MQGDTLMMCNRCLIILVLMSAIAPLRGKEPDLATRLKQLDDKSLSTAGFTTRSLPRMLAEEIRSRRTAVNNSETTAWREIATRQQWETFAIRRVWALNRSLYDTKSAFGAHHGEGQKPKVHVSGRLSGEGYRIENLVFESRPGLWVTANLYLPAKPTKAMPGFIICHSHHAPKTQGELQDMGINWARLGCAVLVMDQLGHGERRVHPFVDVKSYEGKFQPSRQDYYFRYNLSLQLYALGESLMGWMVHDLQRGIDLLWHRDDIDRKRIILLGAVAGGGDPAAVTAALDQRIACVVPFNFGGPQPETTFPLPVDAEKRFNYAGGGSWESTRNLHRSAELPFPFQPWVIVGSVAPRRVIHAHEFAWDQEHDPVWKRYRKIFELEKAPDHLAGTAGKGSVSGRPPESTHCNNIGAYHRKDIYPHLKRWFNIPTPEKENDKRHPASELLCWTPELKKELQPKPLPELLRELGAARMADTKDELAKLGNDKSAALLRSRWKLGSPVPSAKVLGKQSEAIGAVTLERILLEVSKDVVVPVLLLLPRRAEGATLPVVAGVCQEGKKEFLRQRATDIAELLHGGVAICLIDVRGTGETKPEGGRGRNSSASSLSASELMLGGTLLQARLRDLRSVLAYLRTREEINPTRQAIWGESFAPTNPRDANLAMPLDAEKLPSQAEPLGGLLSLFCLLYEKDVIAASGRGGLVSYGSLLEGPFLYVPHDCVIPGALKAGDLETVTTFLSKQGRKLRLTGLVDGLNRPVPDKQLMDPQAKWLRRALKE
jgi:hypothetical protein